MIDYIKQCLKSRTMIFALLLAVTGVIEANMQILATLMSPSAHGFAVAGIGIIVAVLRVVTTTSLSDK